ncbi:MAG: LysR family transcriptional regulator [Clostridia bacterium]|nr:LysR family transcriptional regulator [Clostridia bacterium]
MANLELYRVFYTVAKCGSLTKAAEELFISQPAVSQAIKQLESQLGISLFRRTHRGMELTPEGGKIIVGKVERALSFIDEAEKNLAQVNVSASGIVRIDATSGLFNEHLIRLIASFHEKYPAVKIEFTHDKEEADFLLTDEHTDTGEALYSFAEQEVFVASEKYAELLSGEISANKLYGYPFIGFYPTPQVERAQNLFLKNNGVKLNETIKAPSVEVAKSLAVQGGGIALFPRTCVLAELKSGVLKEIKTEFKSAEREGKLILKKGITSAAVRAFAETVKGESK